jgi:pyruvate dehydrogenase E2 component (dihydrolipoamide acetyltransferase)
MPIEILMPALSPTMTHGNLSKWRKNEGDKIKSGDVLAEIETDKATMEVEAVDEGVLGKIIVPEGSCDVKVNSIIALILEDGESADAIKNYSAQEVQQDLVLPQAQAATVLVEDSKTVRKEEKSEERIFASPLAKKIAKQKNINLSQVNGSGPRGRIVKDDLNNIKSSNRKSTSFERDSKDFEVITLSNMRKVIASRLVESKQTIPHFYLSVECNMDSLLAFRRDINDHLAEQGNSDKISVNDLIIKASAMALRDVPDANASWADTAIHRYNNIDISVAVAIDGGLITPIIKNADFKTVIQISKEMKDLAKRARTTGLAPHEFQGGGFSISNLGMYGIKKFEAIISPPQSCILAIGETTQRPIVKESNIVVANMLDLSLSCDHRVVDGAIGAQFLGALKKYIEKPVLMLIEAI